MKKSLAMTKEKVERLHDRNVHRPEIKLREDPQYQTNKDQEEFYM